jgi:protein SCO1/2
MVRLVSTLILLFGLICPAFSALTQRELASVGFEPPANARIPASLIFQDAAGRSVHLVEALAGRPALVLPVDFTCRTLCGPALTIASAALAQTGFSPRQDFQLVVVGIDPTDTIADARALVTARVADPRLSETAVIMQGDTSSIQAFMAAIGYRAVYDAGADQFAHPAGAVVVTADGRVSRVLSSLALNPGDLRLALTEAGEGRVGSFTDRLALLCSQFDPAHGVYTSAVIRIIQVSAVLTVLLVAGGLLLLNRSQQRARAI